jgi:restriction system protein
MEITTKSSIWTSELINLLEWKRFEKLCTRLFETKGFACKTTNLASNEGIDIHLYFGKDKPVLDRIVHCNTSNQKTGIEPMRALLVLMQSEKARRGTFVSRGGFTQEALDFAAQNNLHTLDSAQLLEMIAGITEPEANLLLEQITENDYVTPTCGCCGIKLLPRSLFSDKPYWICANWKPQGMGCITKIYIDPHQLAALKSLQAA